MDRYPFDFGSAGSPRSTRRAISSASGTSRSSVRASTSILMRSPFSTSAQRAADRRFRRGCNRPRQRSLDHHFSYSLADRHAWHGHLPAWRNALAQRLHDDQRHFAVSHERGHRRPAVRRSPRVLLCDRPRCSCLVPARVHRARPAHSFRRPRTRSGAPQRHQHGSHSRSHVSSRLGFFGALAGVLYAGTQGAADPVSGVPISSPPSPPPFSARPASCQAASIPGAQRSPFISWSLGSPASSFWASARSSRRCSTAAPRDRRHLVPTGARTTGAAVLIPSLSTETKT